MFDCSEDVAAFHNDEVTLPQSSRTEMKNRRDSNRTRLRTGLEKAEKPSPEEFKSQGSYAMKSMVQQPNKDYDIDDGVYFDKEDLVGPQGGEMTALAVRQMVRDAVDDGSFKTAPAVKTNCVRVTYDAGYHVDLPAYRRVVKIDILGNEVTHFELASASWKRSDARDVTAWFEKENSSQSPDTNNGRQLRRVTRKLKAFAKSRDSWKGQILSGFGITKLVVECFASSETREDVALYDTLKTIRDRLLFDLRVEHPVTPNEYITTGSNDATARFFRDKLSDAIRWLEPLFEEDCDQKKALKCWDKVFATTFFSARVKESEASALSSGLFVGSSDPNVVNKQGGGRYA